mgnify:FL=1
MSKTEFLGKLVGNGEVSPISDKVDAIKRAPRPTTKKDLRRFLGMINYYRSHIKDLSKKTDYLNEKLRNGAPNRVKWDEESEKAFIDLKRSLTQAPVLITADHDKTFYVQTDASDRAIGAVLSQVIDTKEHPIAFRSKKLSETQTRWSTIEKELYAIVYVLEQFRYYLYGRKFVIQTTTNLFNGWRA